MRQEQLGSLDLKFDGCEVCPLSRLMTPATVASCGWGLGWAAPGRRVRAKKGTGHRYQAAAARP